MYKPYTEIMSDRHSYLDIVKHGAYLRGLEGRDDVPEYDPKFTNAENAEIEEAYYQGKKELKIKRKKATKMMHPDAITGVVIIQSVALVAILSIKLGKHYHWDLFNGVWIASAILAAHFALFAYVSVYRIVFAIAAIIGWGYVGYPNGIATLLLVTFGIIGNVNALKTIANPGKVTKDPFG